MSWTLPVIVTLYKSKIFCRWQKCHRRSWEGEMMKIVVCCCDASLRKTYFEQQKAGDDWRGVKFYAINPGWMIEGGQMIKIAYCCRNASSPLFYMHCDTHGCVKGPELALPSILWMPLLVDLRLHIFCLPIFYASWSSINCLVKI